MKRLSHRLGEPPSCDLPEIASVRRILQRRELDSLEIRTLFQQYQDTDSILHERAQDYIRHLESELSANRETLGRLAEQQNDLLVRLALLASKFFQKILH